MRARRMIYMNNLTNEQLSEKAKELRKSIITMVYHAGSGHPGGSLSAIDLMTVLFYNKMNHDSKNMQMRNRDRFILSKGHITPALYAILADLGYFEKSELNTLRKFGSILQGHPDMQKTPGIEVSSGSLGQGLSIAVGVSLGGIMDKIDYRVYCMMGDGETQEGQIWEAAMAAGHYKLDNLCGIIDVNRLQIDGKVEDVMNVNPLADKWRAFNWNVIQIDGHKMFEIDNAFDEAKRFKGKPTVIIAQTIKGKGVSFMENNPGWHGKAPNTEQYNIAMDDLNK
jgi:transketolase